MLKEKISKIKNSLIKADGSSNNKKTIENLVVFIILLIVTVVMINYIWNGKEKEKTQKQNLVGAKTLAEEPEKSQVDNDMESKLENILSKIKGVGEIKVAVMYSKTSEIVPMYNEDSSEKLTEETDSNGGNRRVEETTVKKDIIYEENSGVKNPITQSIISPTIEGAIITAKGAGDAQIKANIIQAVEAATGLATHRIQVFEMN
ncbi:MAG: hypothetical protein ACLU33_05570 [Christensenellales bacterium]